MSHLLLTAPVSSDHSKPAGAQVTADASGEVDCSDRAARFMRRADRELQTLYGRSERLEFIDRMLEHWQHRYGVWCRSEGRSEYQEPGSPPIMASDFLLTIAMLGTRRAAIEDQERSS